MTKELRELLWQENVREHVAETSAKLSEESDQDELIERAIDRLIARNNRAQERW